MRAMQPTEARLVALYKSWLPYLVQRACLLLGNRADAEDVAHEVFVRLARGLERDPDLEVSRGALVHIATQVAIDRWRQRRTRAEEPLLSGDGPGTPWHDEDVATRILVRQIMEHLSPDLREIAILRHADGLTLAEIADATGLSVKTIGRRLDTIEKKLSRFR